MTSNASTGVAGEGTLTGANNTINALNFDGAIIQDASTTDNDTLNIIADGANSGPSLVENIETVNIRSTADTATVALAAYSGLMTVNASGAADLGLTGFDQDSQTIGLSGDTDVTLVTAGATAADDEFNVNVEGATGSLTLNDGSVDVTAAAVNVNATGAASAFALSVDGTNLTSVDELTVNLLRISVVRRKIEVALNAVKKPQFS